MTRYTEVYARGENEDQAALRVALHGYGQVTPEDAARGRTPGEHVFLVKVSANRLPERCILPAKKKKHHS